MFAVAADRVEVASAIHRHGAPCEQALLIEWRRDVAIDVDHQLGDTSLGWSRLPIGFEAEVAPDRRLNAFAV